MTATEATGAGLPMVDLHPRPGPDLAWRRLDLASPERREIDGEHWFSLPGETLRQLTAIAFDEIEHLFRPSHLAQLRAILDDPEASENDRYVAGELLRNAVISAGRELPSCQDTGTAVVLGWKGERFRVDGSIVENVSAGIADTFGARNLRFSQLAPTSMWDERNTGNNLPAQIDIHACEGNALELLFIAKGGGSANKTYLFQESKALLSPSRFLPFIDEKLRTLGTAACPPYHLALVVGGLSAEQTLQALKLASTRALDGLPEAGDGLGGAFRDRDLERQILGITRDLGIGAQFGGKYFCHDVRVIRLPRHAGSLPIGLGVSCSADRQIHARIDADGVCLEALETDPARYLPDVDTPAGVSVPMDLDQPMPAIRQRLSALPVGTRLSLTGPLIVARDVVHARLRDRLEAGEPLPGYLRDHPVYYAGPAKTPVGRPSGSFGPTTSARMDSYLPAFQAAGASLVTIGKGNRGRATIESCQAHGGFYLGAPGGIAARIADTAIRHIEAIDHTDLGMEAVWRIEVADFPAVIITDDKGNDLYRS
ncbi:MAG: FumA C-terminus/TtdB family hydratase beta subunit [Azospirillaceae bacterium]